MARPDEIAIARQGSNITFSASESGDWVVEIDTDERGSKKRLQIVFKRVTQARVNDPSDRNLSDGRVLQLVNESPWVREFRDEYLKSCGTKFIAAIENVKHYIAPGHEMWVGILARDVEVRT